MQVLRSHTDIHDSRFSSMVKEWPCMCWAPKAPSSPFCSLPSTCLVLPAEATCCPSNHAVHRKGRAKRPFSPSAQVRVLLAFSVRRGQRLQQPLQVVFCAAHPPLLCGLGSGPSPGAVSQWLPQAGPRGRAGIPEKGKCAGAPARARAAGLTPSKGLCKMWEPSGLRAVQRGKRGRPALRHATLLRRRVTAFKEKK